MRSKKMSCFLLNHVSYTPGHFIWIYEITKGHFIGKVWNAPKACFMNFTWNDECKILNWAASSEFGTYRLCEQRRFRRACATAQSRQNLRCSLIQAVSQEEPSDRKPDPWPLWMAGHAQLKFVMTECSKTQIRLTGLNLWRHKKYCQIHNSLFGLFILYFAIKNKILQVFEKILLCYCSADTNLWILLVSV